MNLLKKIEMNLTALALVPLTNLETRERQRRLKERIERLEQRQKYPDKNQTKL
jgi:BMFP domain-containing protein YqiC